MTRFYLRLMILPLLIAIGAVIVVCAQPHTDSNVSWLPIDNCSEACFLGIRPGETTMEQAEQMLKAHPWVDRLVSIDTDAIRLGWLWNEAAPEFLKQAGINPNRYVDGEITFENDVATTISFNTRLTFGDVALTWAYPDASQVDLSGLMIAPDSSIRAVINVRYETFQISATLSCPYTTHIWQTPIHIDIMDADAEPGYPIVPLGQNFLGSIRRTSQLMCSRQF